MQKLLGLAVAIAAIGPVANADVFSEPVRNATEFMNEVGDRACLGQSSALSRLFFHTNDTDELIAASAYSNLAYLIGPNEPCAEGGFKHDLVKWLEYIEEAVERDWPARQANLGAVLLLGLYDVETDIPRATDLLKAASDQGSSLAAAMLAKGYSEGLIGAGQDAAQAQTYLDRGYALNPSESVMTILDTARDLLAGKPSAEPEPADLIAPVTCVTVDATADWTPITLEHGSFVSFETTGTWSVDKENSRYRDSFGVRQKEHDRIVEKDPSILVYNDQRAKLGQLLLRNSAGNIMPIITTQIQADKGNIYTPRKGDTVHLRINDTSLDNNDGALDVCIMQSLK